MAIIVEHEKRIKEILEKSLDVFIEEGYEDATFQKIADKCGITRTTLYIYFKNKHEIFLGSIKQLLGEMEQSIIAVTVDESLSAEQQLRSIVDVLIEGCMENAKLFHVLLSYLIQLKKTGVDPKERVSRRVIRVRHLLNKVLIKGIKNKEFKDISVADMNQLLYTLIETAVFKIAVYYQEDITEVRESLYLAIDGFLARKAC